jgi:glyoxylase-like metal-dependent hydrolase (beta-lactamase superfamily II)
MLLVAVSFSVGACRTARDRELVRNAVDALGGMQALTSVKSVSEKGTVRYWEPEQSVVADGEPRLACDSTFETVTQYPTGDSRTAWARNFAYPLPRTYTFSEVVTPQAGYVSGIDSTARNKQSQASTSNPPTYTMSGFRLAAAQREMRRTSPLLLLDMAQHLRQVSPAPDVLIGTVAYPAVNYKTGDQTFIVMFDPKTHLPARVRTLDYDNIWGDVNYDLVLSDWEKLDGVNMARTQHYELNGQEVVEIKLTDVKANVPVPADQVAIPADLLASAAKPGTGTVPYQWVLRRQFIGTYLDSDHASYDSKGTGLHLSEVAPGVQQVVGGTHNSLIVEMRDHLIVFDAPISDWQSKWTLDAARQKFPGKPVKYLVLTHHHMDHEGGLRAYAAEGVTLVVGQGNAEHFRRVLAAPFTRNPDLASRDLSGTKIQEVAEREVLTDGTREVVLQVIENPHAAGMVLGYVTDAKLGWVVDLWSPGRDPLPAQLNPNQMALVAAVAKAGLAPVKFAAAHGSVGDYAPLAALATPSPMEKMAETPGRKSLAAGKQPVRGHKYGARHH